MTIKYEESLRLKGVGILMMVWLHCFNNIQDVQYSYFCYWYILGESLIYRTTYLATMVVPLFCFISGYGLAKKFPYNFAYVKQKLRILYTQYWFVLSFFMMVGFLMNRENLTYSLEFFLGNFIGFNTSFNATLWFLLPYALLFVFSKFLFPLLKGRYGGLGLLFSFIGFLVSSKFFKDQANGLMDFDYFTIVFLNCLKLSFPFIAGFFANRYKFPQRHKILIYKYRRLLIVGLLLLMFVKLFIPSYSLSYIYLFPFIVLMHLISFPTKIHKILCFLGRKSTFIWFIHAYFTYYLFSEYVYNLSYSLSIFIVVFIISLLGSVFLEKLYSFSEFYVKHISLK